MTLINIRVQPRASRNEISEVDPDGTLRIRVTAPPTDGEANEAVLKLLAKHLGLPKSALTIVRGATTRNKVIKVEGLTDAEVRQRP
ncbi:MAG: DUF167 domain-containing protein [Chloroflexi bacterium]|nr:DUF167 domain-containing protein [Chloroflexota bacterium]